MSAEQGALDWMEIIDQHNDEHGGHEPLVLQPSEYHRLREDLRCAHSALTFRERQLERLSETASRYCVALERAMALAEGYKKLNGQTADIAQRAISALKDNGATTRPHRPADRPGEETLADFSRRA